MTAVVRPSAIAAIHAFGFVARCTTAAMLAYAAADALGLGHPVWAVVSALIVSQQTVRETRQSYLWRAAGTGMGATVALAAALCLMPDPARPLPATGAAVTVCAAVARRWPSMRVCLWTAPLVILTANAEHSIAATALQRGGEVLLGGLVGAAIHLVLEHAVVRPLANRP
ncbi:MAG: FUSC family protein [Sphingomonas fennica]